MAIYVLVVVIGGAICWGIGSIVERFSDTASLPVFLGCFFLNFWLSWRVALYLTEPKITSAT